MRLIIYDYVAQFLSKLSRNGALVQPRHREEHMYKRNNNMSVLALNVSRALRSSLEALKQKTEADFKLRRRLRELRGIKIVVKRWTGSSVEGAILDVVEEVPHSDSVLLAEQVPNVVRLPRAEVRFADERGRTFSIPLAEIRKISV